MLKRFWEVRGFDSTMEIYEGLVPFGCFSDTQMQDLLRALAAKAGLTFDEIVGAYARRNAKIANPLLTVQKEGHYQRFNGTVAERTLTSSPESLSANSGVVRRSGLHVDRRSNSFALDDTDGSWPDAEQYGDGRNCRRPERVDDGWGGNASSDVDALLQERDSHPHRAYVRIVAAELRLAAPKTNLHAARLRQWRFARSKTCRAGPTLPAC